MQTWGAPARFGTGVVAYAPLIRAALVNLDAWVARGVEPPPSRVPRLADGTGVRRDQSVVDKYARLPGIEPIPEERMRVPRTIDLGPDAELVHRADDQEETVKRRLDEYDAMKR